MAQHSQDQYLGNEHDCQFASDPRKNKVLGSCFKGRHVLIAGGGRGIGRATAEFFAYTEAQSLSLMALELDEVDETARLCKKINPKIVTKTAAFDVRDYPKVQQFIDEVVKDFGRIDVVWANAGRPPQWLGTHESDPQVWWDTVAISLQGAFNFSRAVLPYMRQEKSGRIIFTASAGAHIIEGMSSYMLGKLGMVRLAEALHRENKDYGIKAFAIHPGKVLTRFYTDFRDAANGNIRDDSYVSKTLEGEKKSADAVVHWFRDTEWDTIQMPAGLVVVLASGQLDFLSGRYADASRKIEDYFADKDKILSKDLYRVKLLVDTDSNSFLPPVSSED